MRATFESAIPAQDQAKRRRTWRRSIVAVAVLVCAAPLSACVIGRDRTPQPQPSGPAPVATVVPEPVNLMNSPKHAERRSLTGFLGVTIAVPEWSGAARHDCPLGQVALDEHAQYHADAGKPGLTVLDSAAGDVDHDGHRDRVALLRCGPTGAGGFQAVAYRTGPGGDAGSLIGRVLGTGSGIGAIGDVVIVDSGEVHLSVTDGLLVDGPGFVLHQTRRFMWKSGRFAQSGGPTAFSRPSATAVLTVSADPVALEPVDGGRFLGRVRVTVANTGTADAPGSIVQIFLPEGLQPAEPAWRDCLYDVISDTEAEDFGSAVVTCPVELDAGATLEISRLVVAEQLPALGGHTYAAVSQTEPYVLQSGSAQATTADFEITAGS